MKFIVSSSTLLKHLNYVSGVISPNPSLPILENFLFDLNKTQLSITGSDIETSIYTSVQVESSDEGKVCIPSKILVEYLKSIPEQPIIFNVDTKSSNIKITTSTGAYKFKSEDPKHYPTIPAESGSKKITLKNKYLLDAINNTLFAISNDETRPGMNGLFFELKKDHVNFVSTDGNRLVRLKIKDIDIENEDAFIVPKKPLSLLKNLIQDNDNDINIEYNKNHLFVKTNDVVLVCTFLDANFPDYKSVLPEKMPFQMLISTQDIQKALKRVSIFSSKSNNLVRFTLKGSQLELSAKDEDYEFDADEKLTCQYKGDDLLIGFNSKSLIEILNSIKTSEVIFQFSLPSKPALILPSENLENEELAILQIPLILMSE